MTENDYILDIDAIIKNIENNDLKLYPQVGSMIWCSHKGLPNYKREVSKEQKERNRKFIEERNRKKKEFRERRMDEYNSLDERKYFFTLEQHEEFLRNENFDITQCLWENIFKKEREEQRMKELQRLKEEEENKLFLESLKYHDEDDYCSYYYQNEPFLDNYEDNSDQSYYSYSD